MKSIKVKYNLSTFARPEAFQPTIRMTSSEKFCLKWNDSQDNILHSFRDLREDLDFSDVTLLCDDHTQIEAHRVILSVVLSSGLS